ncbi:MAG TPA: hypothetical protein VH744_06230 [Terriglobales bacterium]
MPNFADWVVAAVVTEAGGAVIGVAGCTAEATDFVGAALVPLLLTAAAVVANVGC